MTATAVPPRAAQPVVNGLPPSRGLRVTWVVAFGSLALAFPVYAYLVFHGHMDRRLMANFMAAQVTVAYFVGIFAAFLPIPSLRRWTGFERLQGVVLPFVICSSQPTSRGSCGGSSCTNRSPALARAPGPTRGGRTSTVETCAISTQTPTS